MSKQYLELKPEDKQWLENREKQDGDTIKVDDYHLTIAEFGKYYGWGGVSAILNNEINSETMAWLLVAARKISKITEYNNAKSSFIGSVSSQSKSPSKTFNELTSDLIRSAKADE